MYIDALRSLFVTIELGSFAAAAGRSGVPPSTVSRRIAELESDLGQKLLIRTGRGVRPVDEARETIARLRDVLLAVDACYTPDAPLTRMRVTCPAEMSCSLLPQVLVRFASDFPKTFVEIQGENRSLGLIEEGYDLSIRAGELSDTSYLMRKLPEDRFVLVASLELAETLHTIDDLIACPTVEVAGFPQGISGHFLGQRFAIRPPSIARFDTFTAAIPIVSSGRTYAMMPSHVAANPISEGRLVALKSVEIDSVPLHALFPRRHRTQKVVSSFIDRVTELLQSSGH